MHGDRARAADLAALTVMVALALAWPLVAPPIGTHGEAREGLVVQDIVRRGHWVLPVRNGEMPSKPPLYHWIAAAGAALLGLSDAAVRLPSALAAWAVLVAVYLVGARGGGRACGWLAVAALAGMHGFVEAASEARVDMVFAAGVTIALAAFLCWHRTENAWARALCYGAVAAAVLTKGPAGAVLVGLVIVAFLLVERRLDRLRALWSWRLAALVLVVDLGWYAAATWIGGREFLARQILHENVDRFVGRGVFGMHGGRSRLAMVENLATDLLPWNLVLVAAAARWWRGAREDEIGRFLHVWWVTVVAVFTAAYGKRGVYLLPLYPAVALLAGRALGSVLTVWRDPARVPEPIVAALGRVGAGSPARALVVLVVAIDLGVLLIGQGVRVRRAGRGSLVPFADEVAARVPAGSPLVADASLDESDLLVLAYRLGRPLPRAACRPGRHRLLTPRPGVPAVAALVAARRHGVPVALVRDTEATCALALDREDDR
ncbi:MAG: glycosyltransferase family 39 protein [Deltaproteobacteria bacterium]|nr:glycosyltransferase family 39 protein [Deltaproteobacteria bacterium]